MGRKAYPIFIPPVEIKENWKTIIETLRKTAALAEIREVAITLALELEPGVVSDLLVQCLPPGMSEDVRKRIEEELARFRDPWWVQRARELYWPAKSVRPPRISDISKARSLLKRYGVPEPYQRLAMLIALKKCDIDF